MPQRKPKEHKCSHHTASAEERSKWRNFHFSGKVIMCSVLFGLGLVLIGGLTLAIGMDQGDDEKSEETKSIENKAPMSIVGPVIMGIGGFTVIVGIIMCLFETNICRKRQSDTRPLISEQATSNGGAMKSSDSNLIDDSSQKRHKKQSGKAHKKSSKHSSSNSPSSPIEVHHGLSREFTASDKFLTPPSSFIPGNNVPNANLGVADDQAAFTSSGKSWNTSSEFRTPASSPEDRLSSDDIQKHLTEDRPISPNMDVPTINSLDPYQHEFLSPMNSYIGDSSKLQESLNSNSDHLPEELHDIQNHEILQNSAKIAETEQNLDMKSSGKSIVETVPIPVQENDAENLDQNSLVNNEIERIDQCLENIEQMKSNQVSNQFNATAVEHELNVDKPTDVNINHTSSDNTNQDNT